MSSLLGKLTDCENRYRRAWLDFSRQWTETKQQWRDTRCHRFEADHLQDLPSTLSRLDRAVTELREALRRAERELADPQKDAD